MRDFLIVALVMAAIFLPQIIVIKMAKDNSKNEEGEFDLR